MPDNSANNKRIAKNSIFLSIRMVIVLCITLYTTRAVLAVLGVVDYGVYNVVCGFVAMFGFLNTSMSNGIQRFFNYELGKNGESGANKVYCTSLLIQFSLAIIIIILTESLGLWYLHNKMVVPVDRVEAAQWIFQLSIISFLFVIIQAPYTAAIIAHERMDFYAVISVLDAVLKLGIVFMIPYLTGDALIWYGFLFCFINIVNFLLYASYARWRFSEIRIRRVFDKELFSSMLGFSGWNIFGTLSRVAQEHGINLVINFFFGPVVNAARGIASQVNAGLKSFVSNITMPVRPQVVQSYAQGNIDRTMNLTYSISKLSCSFFAMMAIPVATEIDFVLHLWLGDNVPEHTDTFTIIVLITSVTSNLNTAASNVVHAIGQMKHYQLWGSLVKMSSVPLAFMLLKASPIPELALICVWVMNLLGHIVGLFVLRTLIPFSLIDYCKRVVIPVLLVIVLGTICTMILHLWMSPGWLRFVSVTAVAVISVLFSLFFVALEEQEKALFKNLLRPIIKRLK